MYKVWESKIKTPRDIVLFQRLQETVIFTYFEKPACKFDRTYCKEIVLKQENDPQFDKFENLIAYFNNVFKITVDKDDWRNSTCTCRFYLKDNKCFHIPIVCASAKIKGCSFESVFMKMAISRKPRRGRKQGKRTIIIKTLNIFKFLNFIIIIQIKLHCKSFFY
jgi:hypothetical protein